jgi:catechol 2,3-dioxygenase-like lactoylglutathione lyase family enzyme
MKRFHAHLAVDSIDASVRFYSRLFGAAPTRRQPDHAEWLLEDPRVHFAISARGHAAGLNHFGFEAESPEELAELRARAEAASPELAADRAGLACCDARSDRHWTLDPQGLAWEHFIAPAACCTALRASAENRPAAQGDCCVPSKSSQGGGACCG